MSGFLAFANVKARGSIEQAARFLGPKTAEQVPGCGRPARNNRSAGYRLCAERHDERPGRHSYQAPDGELNGDLDSPRRSSRKSFTFPMW
jgi:hypothetical protein